MQDALRRAIEQDPSLLMQHPELQSVADQAEAEAVKAKGNSAFAAGKMEEAARLFTRCIELDAGNHIYFSNRAAAFTGMKDYAAAVQDARRCTVLQPKWAKGWSRLGAAYYGLEQFSEVRTCSSALSSISCR
jgi:Flp pilus assembly protein TadD